MTDAAPDRLQRIEQLYHEARQRDAHDRETFLAEACGGDDELLADIRSLLGYERAADGFLERPALSEAARTLAAEARPALAGQEIAGYEIVALIGGGGMGDVYRARDRRLGRDVALKVLEPTLSADSDYRRRFEHEAQLASALNHPNIVTIYSVGEERDVSFITMELVKGHTLRHLLTSPMPVPAVVDISVQLASALTAAHGAGIVHRDLKPENLMVTPEGLVKVLDFGIAKRTGGPADAEGAVGTVGYMSPEQALGQPVGPASDQFAVGAILYEMLTGRHAFRRESRLETLEAIIHEEPRPIQALNPRVPAAMRQIVARCLSKLPEARYPSARDLEHALQQVREALSQLPTRRHLLWIGAGTAAAALAGTATWMLWPPHSLAVLPFVNSAQDDAVEYWCLGLAESLIERMKHLPLAVKPVSVIKNFAGSTTDARAIGQRLGVDHVVTGTVAAGGGRLMVSSTLIDVATGASIWTQRYDRETTSFFKLWDDLAQAIVDDGLHLRLRKDERRALLSRPTDNLEAYDLFLRARRFQLMNSEDDYLEARRLLQQSVDKDSRFAQAWLALGGTYWASALANYAPPAESWSQAERCMAEAAALNPRLPNLILGRAMKSFYADWNWAEAARQWQIAEAASDLDLEPELVMAHAFAAWALGDARDALRLIQRARRIDPISEDFVLHEASYLLYTGHVDEAAERCISVIDTHLDPSAPYFSLAEVRRAQGRFDEAIEAIRKAYSLTSESDEEVDTALAEATGKDGYARIEMTVVRRLELPSLRRRARHDYASPLDFARAYAQLGESDTAFEYLDQAFTDRSPGLVLLNVDRAWDAIRADPRFRAAVRRVGLPS